MILSTQGQGLLTHLRQLFAGHHARAEDITPVNERTDQYPVSVHVIWQFDHDVNTRSVAGNAAIQGSHFGTDDAAFQQHLQSLRQRAAQDREIRGPFMQHIDMAGADGLAHSSQNQLVHDFGSYSRLRNCGTCRGSGQVSCGGCSGHGKRTCGGCGGGGRTQRVVSGTRWNGRFNESYSQTVYDTCSSCGGGGRTVCTACGGSGNQRCGTCAGHGFFTDIAEVHGIARPHWIVPSHSGLAADALVGALKRGGPMRARHLVALDLAGTRYDDDDNWVASYQGQADIVELDITVVKQPYTLAAAGSHAVPITTPPVFDQLLNDELTRITALRRGKRGDARVKRQARKLFSTFCDLPVVDRGMRQLAKRDKQSQAEPGPVIQREAQGFMTAEAAALIGGALLHILNRVSPSHSTWSWRLITAVPAVAGFVLTAEAFNLLAPQSVWSALFPLGVGLVQTAIAMVVLGPVAWLLSLIVSAIMRRKVPTEYRQRGRNWVPFKGAVKFCLLAVVLGALYGTAASRNWVPSIGQLASPGIEYVRKFVPVGSQADRLLGMMQPPAARVPQPLSEAQTINLVQRKLIREGYLRGRADSQLGPRTQTAIAKYKHAHNLDAKLSLVDLWTYMLTH